jgi:hypothetical protein
VRLRDAAGWAAAVHANPPPDGCPPEPEEWPPYEQLTDDQRGQAYGNIVIVAARRWAEAMEPRLDAGESLADIADDTFRAVDRDLGNLGLTVFQYGAAVSILAQVWQHGEELRRCHNLATQFGDEGERANETGGVLNPALLNIEERP